MGEIKRSVWRQRGWNLEWRCRGSRTDQSPQVRVKLLSVLSSCLRMLLMLCWWISYLCFLSRETVSGGWLYELLMLVLGMLDEERKHRNEKHHIVYLTRLWSPASQLLRRDTVR